MDNGPTAFYGLVFEPISFFFGEGGVSGWDKFPLTLPSLLMEVGHVGMEEGLGNPVVVLRVSPPLCIKTHHHCHHHFSINQLINQPTIDQFSQFSCPHSCLT